MTRRQKHFICGMPLTEANNQRARVRQHARRHVDQPEPQRLQTTRRPFTAKSQGLHQRVQVERKHAHPPPRRIRSKFTRGKRAAGQIRLQNTMRLLALAATLVQPLEKILPGPIHIRYSAMYLVSFSVFLHNRKEICALLLTARQ
jgi:hypothetical protein